MKKLIISISCLLSLTGCYEFAKSPFSESEMTLLEDSKITKDVIEILNKFPIEETEVFEDIKEIYEFSPTIEVAEFIHEDGNVTLVMFMKNEHHAMACDLSNAYDILEDDDLLMELGGNVDIQADSWGYIIDGDVAELKKWTDSYILQAPKVCYAVPYN